MGTSGKGGPQTVPHFLSVRYKLDPTGKAWPQLHMPSKSVDQVLAGKTALVTGATAGIGRETAVKLAELGATVIVGCRDVHTAEKVASRIRSRDRRLQVEVGPRLDLGEPGSIEAFAAALERAHTALHILVNNAGANYLPAKACTEQGVPLLVQVNYLGPYHLTRLLQKKLLAGAPARVVNVSSVTHRYGILDDVQTFLGRAGSDTTGRGYPSTKLANVLFSNELQKRYGPQGLQAASVDPGAVFTNIYHKSPLFNLPPVRLMMRLLYAPASDGCTAVVDACTAPWPKVRRENGTSCEPEELRLYARGAFASQAVTSFKGPEQGRLGLEAYAWGASTLILSLLDWPVRRLSGYRLWACTRQVPAAPAASREATAVELWNSSAALTGLPRD